MEKENFSVFVIWGQPSSEQEPEEYTFQSAAELDAFVLGINLASEWTESQIFTTLDEALEALK